MNHKTAEHNSCASDSTRFFFVPKFRQRRVPRTSLCTTKKKEARHGQKKYQFMGGAASPLPATPSRNRTKRQNQSIRKNSTIPQSNFYFSWDLSPEDQPAECHQPLDSPPKAPPTPTPQPPTAYFLKSSYYHFLNHYAYPAMLNVIMALYPSYLKQDTSSGRSRSI